MTLNAVGGSSFADAVAKSLYIETAQDATFKDKPCLALFTKSEGIGGKDIPYPIKYAKPQGYSMDFATAQANATNSTWAQFLLQLNESHQVLHLTSRQIKALNGSQDGFVVLLRDEMQSAMQNMSQKIETQLTRDGSMNLGRIATTETVTGTDITLAAQVSIVNFEVGMRLVAAGTATNTAGLRSAGAAAAVTGVNRKTYTLTFAAGLSTYIAAVAAGDYLFEEGTVSVAGVAAGDYQGIRGLEAHLPTTAPSASESFFGLDRSVDDRLYGYATDASTTTSTFQEAIIDAEGNIAQYHSGSPDLCLMSSADFRRLRKEAQLDVESEVAVGSGSASMGERVMKYGFGGVKIQGDRSVVRCIPAFKKTDGTAFLLELSTWDLLSMGPIVQWDDADGNTILRRSNASGIEGRLISWANLACNKPGNNGVVTLP